MRRTSAIILVGLGGLAACGNGRGDGKAGPEGASTAGAVTTAVGAAMTPGKTAAGATPGAATRLPAGRSAVPTLAEWDSLKKEVTVKGSSALKCETKIVREYLRISCHGKNETGGTPKGVMVVKGGHGEASTYAADGVTSLIVPYVEGINLEATFAWTDKSYKLVINWPKGAKMPPMIGAFEGAASPLDGTTKGDGQKLCECFKKVTKQTTCEDIIGGADADCERSYGGDCEALLECSRGEPGRPPKCLSGFANFGPALRCQPVCGPGKPPCAAGSTCITDFGQPVCVESY